MISKYAKTSFFFFSATLLVISAGCDHGHNKVVDDFLATPTTTFDGGVSVGERDSAKYRVSVDNKNATFTLEVRNDGRCYRATGKIPLDTIGGIDPNERNYEFNNLRIQIQPRASESLNYNAQFVHVVMARNAATLAEHCSPPVGAIASQKLAERLQQDYFSEFSLSSEQRQRATTSLRRGSNTTMFFFKEEDVGIALDAMTGQIAGIDIPKHKLETDYLFTVNRPSLHTNRIPENELFPLLMDAEDQRIFMHTQGMVRDLRTTLETAKRSSPEDQQMLLNSAWAKFFNNH